MASSALPSYSYEMNSKAYCEGTLWQQTKEAGKENAEKGFVLCLALKKNMKSSVFLFFWRVNLFVWNRKEWFKHARSTQSWRKTSANNIHPPCRLTAKKP